MQFQFLRTIHRKINEYSGCSYTGWLKNLPSRTICFAIWLHLAARRRGDYSVPNENMV